MQRFMQWWFRGAKQSVTKARKSSRPKVEALEDRFLPSVTVTEVENNNTKRLANSVTIPDDGAVQLVGTSTSSKDNDFFRFTAVQTGSLSAQVHAVNSVFAKLEIEDRFGNDVLETEPKNGVNSATGNVVAGQTYFARLRAPGRVAAAYETDLTFASATPAPVAAPRTAVTQSSGTITFDDTGAATLTGTSNHHNHKVLYVFVAPTTGTLNLNVTFTNSQKSQLEIKNKAGVNLFETQPNDNVNSGSLAVTAGATYYLRMRAVGKVAASFQVDLQMS